MTPTQKIVDERISRCDTVEEVSRLFFPTYWELKDAQGDEAEAALEEALTGHDKICPSYLQ